MYGPERRRRQADLVDDNAFDLALTDNGRTVRARVFVDGNGAPTGFSTTDRFRSDPDQPKR